MILTKITKPAFVFGILGILPQGLLAAEESASRLDLAGHWVGWLSIGLFALAYVLVMAKERKVFEALRAWLIRTGFDFRFKWAPVIAVGYVASIFVPMAVNSYYFIGN